MVSSDTSRSSSRSSSNSSSSSSSEEDRKRTKHKKEMKQKQKKYSQHNKKGKKYRDRSISRKRRVKEQQQQQQQKQKRRSSSSRDSSSESRSRSIRRRKRSNSRRNNNNKQKNNNNRQRSRSIEKLKKLEKLKKKEEMVQQEAERQKKEEEDKKLREQEDKIKEKENLKQLRLARAIALRMEREDDKPKKYEDNQMQQQQQQQQLNNTQYQQTQQTQQQNSLQQQQQQQQQQQIMQDQIKMENDEELEQRNYQEFNENNKDQFIDELELEDEGELIEEEENRKKEENIQQETSGVYTNIIFNLQQNYYDDEDDPLDAYMKSIQDVATKQETFKISSGANQQPVFENIEDEQVIDETKIITMEDLFKQQQKQNGEQQQQQYKLEEEQVQQQQEQQQQKMEEEEQENELEENMVQDDDDNEFYEAFIHAMKNNGDLQQAKERRVQEVNGIKKEQQQQQVNNSIQQQKQQQNGRELCYNEDDEMDVKEEVVIEEDDFVTKQKKMQEKKDLKPIDHSQIVYEPIRKCLYVETKEINMLTEKEVEKIRFDLGEIKVRGKGCPNPIRNWYQCGLSNKLLQVLIDKKKFHEPFPIQCQAIPAVMFGRDVIGIAETGSGKTLAYLLPMFRHIMDQRPIEEGEGPIGLIMAPTRELAWQIFNDAKSFAKALNLRVVCVYGGAGVAGQLSDLKRGAEIVVCTPGRMIDVLTTSNGKITNLKRVSYVVIDEADRMFDLGFEPQISKILGNVRPDKQTVMFSATFPKNVENLAKRILNTPIEIIVGSRGKAAQNVEQIVEVREESTKFLRLLEILGEWSERGSILVFVDKQVEADELFKELLKYGYYPLVLHGGQDQTDREFTIADFKKGVRTLMVATSVCARGLDIKSLVLVVNFKCPNHLEDYIHRIGRTGRAGNKGTAITFITPDEDQHAEDLLKALKMNNFEPTLELVELAENFRNKVEKGQAKQYKSQFRRGQGFKFDDHERQRIKDSKSAMKRQFGLELNLSDFDELSDDDIVSKKEKSEAQKMGGKKSEKEILQLIKDPIIKAAVMEAATKAAKDAIQAGASSEEVLLAAQNAINHVLQTYKPTASTVESGLEQVIKLRDEFEARGDDTSDKLTAELEINDYPASARQKVTNRDFLGMIADLTGCTVQVRGSYFESVKKVPLGQRKQYLHIEGDSKFNVASAYRDILRLLEDAAIQTLHSSAAGKYKI